MTSARRAPRERSRRGEGDRLRDEILDAAETLLINKADAEAVSIRAVCDAVGVTAPAIYRHFADKDQLMLAVCERGFAQLDIALVRARAAAPDPVEALLACAKAYVDFALENPGQYRMLFMHKGDLHDDREDADWLEAPGMNAFHGLVNAVQQAVDADLLKASDAQAVAVMLWTSVHGVASLRLSMPDFPWPPLEEQLKQLNDVLIAGLARD
ncbi:MAG: TetR/AcrR family transcriptional regulator [Acidimicrobiia bacterium]